MANDDHIALLTKGAISSSAGASTLGFCPQPRRFECPAPLSFGSLPPECKGIRVLPARESIPAQPRQTLSHAHAPATIVTISGAWREAVAPPARAALDSSTARSCLSVAIER